MARRWVSRRGGTPELAYSRAAQDAERGRRAAQRPTTGSAGSARGKPVGSGTRSARGRGVAAQWLFCPLLDDRTAPDRTRDAEAHLIWTTRSNLVGWRSYLGQVFGTDDVPRYSVAARREDLSGLPPAWLYTSHIELFHDEDVASAQRLRAAGVDTTLEVISGAPHGVEAWAADSDIARGLLGRARRWLGGTLGSVEARPPPASGYPGSGLCAYPQKPRSG